MAATGLIVASTSSASSRPFFWGVRRARHAPPLASPCTVGPAQGPCSRAPPQHLQPNRQYRSRTIASVASPILEDSAPSSSSCEEIMERLHAPATLVSSIGLPLTPEEQQSLLLCLHSVNLGVDTCLAAGMDVLHAHVVKFLDHVGVTHTEDLQVVEGAMLLVEQLAMSLGYCSMVTPEGSSDHRGGVPPGHVVPEDPALQGRWQMIVTTAGGWPRLQYIPILEYFEVMPDNVHFRLDTKVGPLFTTYQGQVEWASRDFLRYHVVDMKVEVVGAKISLPASVPGNDLKVFAVGKDVAVARSQAGGLLLMARPC